MIQKILNSTDEQGLGQVLNPLALTINFDPATKEVVNINLSYGLYSIGVNGLEKFKKSFSPIWTNENKRVVKDGQGNDVYEEYESPVLDENGNATFDEQNNPIVEVLSRVKMEGEVEYWNRTLGVYILPAIQNTLNQLSQIHEQ